MQVSEEDKKAFRDFYESSRTRLAKRIGAWNCANAQDPQPLLASFTEAFADLNSGGKLLRGMLVHLGAHLAGMEDLSEGDGLALAFEIFQTAVLIHDDIIDHATIRRGKACVHKRYEGSLNERGIRDRAGDTPSSAALCTGDLGLYLANLAIAEAYASHPRLPAVLAYFDRVVLDTIRGELLDVILPCEWTDPSLSDEDRAKLLSSSVSEIYYLKTAQYSTVGPAHAGMILAGAEEELLRDVDGLMTYLGEMFQIRDDVLGIFASGDVMGKDAAGDIAEGKLTILYQYVQAHSPQHTAELEEYYGTGCVTAAEIAAVQRIFRESGALAHAMSRAQELSDSAAEIIDGMHVTEEDRKILRGLLDYLESRTH